MTNQFAIMNIEKGEEIVSALVGGCIPATGRYKFLAKKNTKGKYEWAHFVERNNGLKENIYRGEVENLEKLDLLMEIMNRTLVRIFGKEAEMKAGLPEIRPLFGNKKEGRVN